MSRLPGLALAFEGKLVQSVLSGCALLFPLPVSCDGPDAASQGVPHLLRECMLGFPFVCEMDNRGSKMEEKDNRIIGHINAHVLDQIIQVNRREAEGRGPVDS